MMKMYSRIHTESNPTTVIRGIRNWPEGALWILVRPPHAQIEASGTLSDYLAASSSTTAPLLRRRRRLLRACALPTPPVLQALPRQLPPIIRHISSESSTYGRPQSL